MTPVMGVLLSNLLLTEQNGVSALNLVVTLVLVCAGILILNYKRRDGTGGADFAGLRRRRLLGRGQKKRARRTENPRGGKFSARGWRQSRQPLKDTGRFVLRSRFPVSLSSPFRRTKGNFAHSAHKIALLYCRGICPPGACPGGQTGF